MAATRSSDNERKPKSEAAVQEVAGTVEKVTAPAQEVPTAAQEVAASVREGATTAQVLPSTLQEVPASGEVSSIVE